MLPQCRLLKWLASTVRCVVLHFNVGYSVREGERVAARVRTDSNPKYPMKESSDKESRPSNKQRETCVSRSAPILEHSYAVNISDTCSAGSWPGYAGLPLVRLQTLNWWNCYFNMSKFGFLFLSCRLFYFVYTLMPRFCDYYHYSICDRTSSRCDSASSCLTERWLGCRLD